MEEFEKELENNEGIAKRQKTGDATAITTRTVPLASPPTQSTPSTIQSLRRQNPFQVNNQTMVLPAAKHLQQMIDKKNKDLNIQTLFLYEDVGEQVSHETHPVVAIRGAGDMEFHDLKTAAEAFGKVIADLSFVDPYFNIAIITFKNEDEADAARAELGTSLGVQTIDITEMEESEICPETALNIWFRDQGYLISEIESTIKGPYRGIKILPEKQTVVVSFLRRADMEAWKNEKTMIRGKVIQKKESYRNVKRYQAFAAPIPYKFTQRALKKALREQLGMNNIKVKLIRDAKTNKSKGCCYVKFNSADDRRRAFTMAIILEGKAVNLSKIEKKDRNNTLNV